MQMAKTPQPETTLTLDQRVDALEKLAHPPIDLGPAIATILGESEELATLVAETVKAQLADALPGAIVVVLDERLPDAIAVSVGEAVPALLVDKPELIGPPLDQLIGCPEFDEKLARRIQELIPETAEQRAERERADRVADREAAARRERSAEHKASREREKSSAAERERRAVLAAGARDDFAALIETGDGAFDLATLDNLKLRVDDGYGFSIDFHRAIDAGTLRATPEGLALDHAPILLGENWPEAFAVRGVVLIGEGAEGFMATRCELPAAVIAGGGATVQLSENSIVFRPR